ncbi:hypothetical protein T03_9685 [Trichinella britovi]|uniref:Uncharacterized protein n=1 Tax=Trichinella britovi TaxID=45882 RepID=A0A0V0YSR2_TRIBR|nr:hypothetical protein T03_9685 [Trichinella britovi]
MSVESLTSQCNGSTNPGSPLFNGCKCLSNNDLVTVLLGSELTN